MWSIIQVMYVEYYPGKVTEISEVRSTIFESVAKKEISFLL